MTSLSPRGVLVPPATSVVVPPAPPPIAVVVVVVLAAYVSAVAAALVAAGGGGDLAAGEEAPALGTEDEAVLLVRLRVRFQAVLRLTASLQEDIVNICLKKHLIGL